MKDKKGSLFIFDAILAILLLLVVLLVFNSIISIPQPHYSESMSDFTKAQDIMETLDKGVNFTDKTFLEEISIQLMNGDNSQEAIRNVSDICKDKFKSFELDNFKFSETNVLEGKVLAGSGDYNGENVSVASRSFGDYVYTLSVW